MAIDADKCDKCDNLIVFDGKELNSLIECDICGTPYKVKESWDEEDREYKRYLEIDE